MLSRLLVVAGATAVIAAPTAAADPEPVPPPNVNALPPVNVTQYAAMDNSWYAFSPAEGVTCVLQRSGYYGCNGALPGAPGGANLVSGQIGGVPGFSNTPAPVFAVAGPVKALPAGSRISFQTVSCGTDGATTTCVDSRNQSGFVTGPGGTFVLNASNPLLDRPDGTNPYFN